MNPPMPHPHQAPVHPGDRPHVPFGNPAGPMNPSYLANQMRQLHIQEDRLSPSLEARPRDFIDDIDIDERTGTCYVGYTFFKAQTTPDSQPTWKKAERSKMNLRQNDLADLVRKNSKKTSVATQYQNLSIAKRTHVDRLIEDLRHSNPRFHWTCVYVKEEIRDVKGKNFRRGDYETTSMTIILMGKSMRSMSRSSSGESIHLRDQRPAHSQRLSPENQHRPAVVNGPYTDPRHGPNYAPTPVPPHMPNMQPGPAQFHQQGQPPFRPPPQNVMGGPVHPEPAQFHQQGPPPSRPPPQNVMGGPAHPEQGNWTQNVPRSQPPHPAPVVHNHINHPPVPNARPDAPDHGGRRPAVNPEPMTHRREIPPPATNRKNPQVKVGGKRDKSPKHRHGSEPDLTADETSSGDEILTPDYDGENSEEEFSSREAKSTRTPWRGSLHRGHSSSKHRHGYRTHYRKEPQRIEERGHRRYRDNGIVDIYPAASTHAARQLGRAHGSTRHWGAQPRILHQQPSHDDMELLLAQARGRAQHDIRSRMLNDWEAELAEREHIFEYQKQMLKDSIRNERMDDIGFINRSRSLRDHQLPPYHHRGYLN
ncbi:uncharacterized protein BDV17DRAFT_289362 [Aspergillus undulatus]|uniref:uncharacterized protein n=1 Tax=Aspergillus undulatus TaxID=1810928 RepID=UPI003CCD4B24